MVTYCVSCMKNTVNKNLRVRGTKQKRLILVSNCAILGKKKSSFIKNQERSVLLCKLGIRIRLIKIPLNVH